MTASLPSRHWIKRLLAGLACVALAAGGVSAQPLSEATVKAGFVFNFAKFTLWPEAKHADDVTLGICALGAHPLDGQLALLQGRQIGKRTLQVRANVPPNEWRDCHVLYVSNAQAARVELVVRTVAGAPVLTVSDAPGFIEAGGMIGLHVEDSRLRFDINKGAAERAGLKLNSQMLKLAGQVLQ